MVRPSRDAFAALLARLDRTDLVQFVADVHRARGRSVTVEAGTVLVEASDRMGRARRLFVPARRHLFGWGRDAGPVDAVVVVERTARVERLARRHGAEVVDASDLHDLLVHGVDASTRDGLCRRHFDRPASALGDTTVRSGSGFVALEWVPTGRALVALFATAALLVGVLAGPASAPPVGQAGDGNPRLTPATTPTTRAPSPARVDGGYPPGVDERGVTDALALSGAHSTALTERSYTVTVRRRVAVPNGTRRTTIDVRVAANASTYHYVLTESVNGSLDRRSPVPRIEFWYDGETSVARYVRSNGSAVYGVDRTPDPDGPVVDPTDYRRLTLALRTFDVARVGVAPTDEAVYHRLRSSTLSRPTLLWIGDFGPPPVSDSSQNATFAAWVGNDGVVHRYVVGYDADVDGRRGRVTHAVAFTDVGETAVSRPAWVETAMRRDERSTNATNRGGDDDAPAAQT